MIAAVGVNVRTCVGACGLLVVFLSLCGCTVVDSVDQRFDNVNRSAARARNLSILLNIVRASRNEPLSFVAFSRVTANTSASASLGLPSFAIGPKPFPTSVQADTLVTDKVFTTSSGVVTSMDLTVLESRDFYAALLNPVDLPTFTFFARQGYSRELLFRLFTNSVRMNIAGRRIELRNEPRGACAPVKGGRSLCFSELVDMAIASGLTAETRLAESPAPKRSGQQGESSSGRKIIYGRLSFDPALAARARSDYPSVQLLASPAAHRPLCETSDWRPKI